MPDGDRFDPVTRLLAQGGPLPIDPLAGRVVAATVEAALFGTDPGVDLGRYRVERRVGQGGGGTVYRGRDPELGRPIAIKILHASRRDVARLRREAHALARVTHPRVLEIYDVLTPSVDRVVLITAWIDGCSLEDWLAEAIREPAEILSAFAAVGHGLTAVHAAGLVHRDVKPSNVLVRRGDEPVADRIVLADFGLAQATEAAPTIRLENAESRTQPLACAGTPGYMAPEQRSGGAIDARADQWSFCAALFEALCGVLPSDDRAGALQCWRATAATAAVPARVRRAVLRGLAEDPDARLPDMRALLDAIAPRSGARGFAVVGAMATLFAAGVVAVLAPVRGDGCTRAAEQITELWQARAPEVERAFATTGVGYAADAFARVDGAMRGHADRWGAHAIASCDAALDAAEQDRRQMCLQVQRWNAESLVDELARADAALVQRSAGAVLGLSSPAICDTADRAGLDAWQPDDPQARREADRLTQQLSHARAEALTGRWASAVPRTSAVVDEAQRLGLDPLALVARIDLGRQRVLAGELEAGRDVLDEAYWDALAGRHDAEAARAASALAFTVGYRLAEVEEGRAWIRHAEAALDRLAADDERRAELWSHLGSIESLAGRHDEARALHLRALEIREAHGAERPDELAHTLNNLGNVDIELGNYGEARVSHERALQLRRESLGDHHPRVATSLNNLGSVQLLSGRPELARATFEQALATWETILGPEHADLIWVLYNLAILAKEAGDPVVARPYALRALALAETQLPADHPQLAFAVLALGHVEMLDRRPSAALALFERAHRLLSTRFGPEHHDVGSAQHAIGLALRDLGRHRESAAAFEASWSTLHATLGDGHDLTKTAAENLALARDRATP
jgi:eukaryotic-like serine/threonine-protein kinase